MDSKERQELKQNDLQEFLINFRAWWDKYGTYLLLAILLVVGSLFFTRWYTGREDRALEAAYAELAAASLPIGKQEVALRYEHLPGVPGKARLEAANLLLAEAMDLTPVSERGPLSDQERERRLGEAADLYRQVIERSDSALQVLNARFGLAAALESLGQFDEAEHQYERIQAEAGDRWPMLTSRAQRLVADMQRIAQPVHLAEAPARPLPDLPFDAGDQPLELPPGLIPDDLDIPGSAAPPVPLDPEPIPGD